VPSTIATRRCTEDRSSGLRVGVLAHAAHTLSHGCGERAFRGALQAPGRG
jgi:hypothetical protein